MVDRIDLMWPGLKKCPFCGSHDIATSVCKTYIGQTVYYEARIACTGCWAYTSGSIVNTENGAIERAAAAWNRRARDVVKASLEEIASWKRKGEP